MKIVELKRKRKILNRKKKKLKTKYERLYKSELSQLEEELFAIDLQLKAKEKNTQTIYSTKPLVKSSIYNPTTYPQRPKNRRKRGLETDSGLKIADVETSFQIFRKRKKLGIKPQPINRQAARAVGIYKKTK
jgi:hypothetical protein